MRRSRPPTSVAQTQKPSPAPTPKGQTPLDYSPREHDEESDTALEAILQAERDEEDAAAYHTLMQADW